MAPPQHLQHRRTHNLLLISKLLNNRDNVSPFTLIIDSLEQSGKPLVREYIRRAKVRARNSTSLVHVMAASSDTSHGQVRQDTFLSAGRMSIAALQRDIASCVNNVAGTGTRTLLVVDTLNHAAISDHVNLPAFLSSLITPSASLLAVYHSDVITTTSSNSSPYAPNPLTLLKYLSTTLFTVHSLTHILAAKAARERSLASPVFGLAEEKEGVVVGLGANDVNEARGIVIEMEHRRKSGRGVGEWFFLPFPHRGSTDATSPPSGAAPAVARKANKETIILLEDHPLYRSVSAEDQAGDEGVESTFNLGLTEKQRRSREGVVLPYFDAQRVEGGEGGRILYEMGVEDDFDEEEDEI